MTMGKDNPVDQLRIDVRVAKPFGRVHRGVNHDTVMIKPDDVSGRVLGRIKAVTGTETGDTEKRRDVRLGEPFAYCIGRFVGKRAGNGGNQFCAVEDLESTRIIIGNGRFVDGTLFILEYMNSHDIG